MFYSFNVKMVKSNVNIGVFENLLQNIGFNEKNLKVFV